jgi:hypothetical protein
METLTHKTAQLGDSFLGLEDGPGWRSTLKGSKLSARALGRLRLLSHAQRRLIQLEITEIDGLEVA